MVFRSPQLQNLKAGDGVEGFYILSEASVKSTQAGKPFLSARLMDRTGTLEAKMWDYSGTIGPAQAGEIVKIRGNVSEFKGTLQIQIERLRLKTPADAVDISALIPTAPIAVDEALHTVESLVASIVDREYRSICDEMMSRHKPAFVSLPAAAKVHHAFLHGLLMHTCNMMRTADFLAGLYGDFVDRDLLLAGTFLHDFAKYAEFQLSELGLVTDYSVRGQLLGHLVMGAMEVSELAKVTGVSEEKSVLLQHLVLSHHGEPAYGAAVKPVCAESELLSMIDTMDARMEQFREVLENMDAPGFSEKNYFLGGRRIYNHGGERG